MSLINSLDLEDRVNIEAGKNSIRVKLEKLRIKDLLASFQFETTHPF